LLLAPPLPCTGAGAEEPPTEVDRDLPRADAAATGVERAPPPRRSRRLDAAIARSGERGWGKVIMMERERFGGSNWSVAARRALLVPTLALLSACSDDSDPVALDGDEFLDEVFHFTVENNIQFGSAVAASGQTQPLLLDLFLPRTNAGSRPAILWLHGGGFTEGHKGEMTEYARRFAQRGYVAAAIDYRLRPEALFDYTDPDDPIGEAAKLDAQHDALAAVRWLRANADRLGIDTDNIIIGGYSAGATAALRAALRPNDPGTSGNPGFSSSVAAVVSVAGFPDGLGTSSIPVLALHGEQDTKVRIATVERACDSAASCQLVPIANADHTVLSAQRDLIIAETARFLFERVVSR
jgi:acetyl esterase/lipase